LQFTWPKTTWTKVISHALLISESQDGTQSASHLLPNRLTTSEVSQNKTTLLIC
jgi:hypothetical protein